MDRDTTPIGGLENPLPPSRQLYYATIALDIIGVLLSLFVSIFFAMGMLLFILVSKAYSYRNIRLKQYPVIAWLLVVMFQGISTFIFVYAGVETAPNTAIPYPAAIAAGLLIGGFYPLTQIYQHAADKKDGVTTISYLLGYKGTFIFSALLYCAAFALLYYWFTHTNQETSLYLLLGLFLPAIFYFLIFAKKVWQEKQEANFRNTMRMTWIAAVCTNLAFLLILTYKHLE